MTSPKLCQCYEQLTSMCIHEETPTISLLITSNHLYIVAILCLSSCTQCLMQRGIVRFWIPVHLFRDVVI